jgi:hypothetical protein
LEVSLRLTDSLVVTVDCQNNLKLQETYLSKSSENQYLLYFSVFYTPFPGSKEHCDKSLNPPITASGTTATEQGSVFISSTDTLESAPPHLHTLLNDRR